MQDQLMLVPKERAHSEIGLVPDEHSKPAGQSEWHRWSGRAGSSCFRCNRLELASHRRSAQFWARQPSLINILRVDAVLAAPLDAADRVIGF
jgi:hypothetical protein